MITKLERWMWLGGALLAANAGLINAVGLESFAHQAVTHVTGTTSLWVRAVEEGEGVTVMHLGLVLGSFFVGAGICGLIVKNSPLKLGRRYGVALLVESVLLTVAAISLKSHSLIGSYLTSAACGLQNAMASTFTGSVLRTTHLSGMVTDVGAAVGHWLGGARVDWIRVRLFSLLIASFAVGGLCGSLLFRTLSYATLYVPAALTGGVAVAYTLYTARREKKVHSTA